MGAEKYRVGTSLEAVIPGHRTDGQIGLDILTFVEALKHAIGKAQAAKGRHAALGEAGSTIYSGPADCGGT